VNEEESKSVSEETDSASGAKDPEQAKATGGATGARSKRTAEPASWGYPQFARNFPRHAELDALVAAFARGDYATVRSGAPKLAAEAGDEEVKRAAQLLRERIEPDPTSKAIFLIAAALLVFLTAWWVAHDGPEDNAPSSKVAPKVQHAD
jgi:hypothetical protein